MDERIVFTRRIIPATETAFVVPAFPLLGAAIDLWFEKGLYYDGGSVADPTGDLSCSRASTGYVKSSGTLISVATNTLRIGTGTGLLIEESRTNIQTRSQNFTNVSIYSTVNTTVTDNATTAPDGTTTAGNVVPSTSFASHSLNATTGSITATASVTITCYLKAAGYNFAYLKSYDAAADAGYIVVIDLTAGTVTTTTDGSGSAPTGTSNFTEQMANGWWRLSVTRIMPNNALIPVIGVNNASTYNTNWTGDGVSGIYCWGLQVENATTFPTSYIPTTTVSVTRAADNITIIGNALTDIGTGTASIVAQVNSQGTAGVATNVVDSNGTNLLGYNSSNNALASLVTTLTTSNTGHRTTLDKLGISWDPSGRNLVINAGTVATDATAQTPSAVTEHLGSTGSANFVNGYMGRLAIWTTKLSGSSLQGFTT